MENPLENELEDRLSAPATGKKRNREPQQTDEEENQVPRQQQQGFKMVLLSSDDDSDDSNEDEEEDALTQPLMMSNVSSEKEARIMLYRARTSAFDAMEKTSRLSVEVLKMKTQGLLNSDPYSFAKCMRILPEEFPNLQPEMRVKAASLFREDIFRQVWISYNPEMRKYLVSEDFKPFL